jgi:hypothetical protein
MPPGSRRACCGRRCWRALNVSTALTDPLKFCPPGDTQAEQGVRAVVAYIEKRPERGWEDFTTVALEALRASWPC